MSEYDFWLNVFLLAFMFLAILFGTVIHAKSLWGLRASLEAHVKECAKEAK